MVSTQVSERPVEDWSSEGRVQAGASMEGSPTECHNAAVAIFKTAYVSGPNATKESAEAIFRSLWPEYRYVRVRQASRRDDPGRFRVVGFWGPAGRPKRGFEPPLQQPGITPPDDIRRIRLPAASALALEDCVLPESADIVSGRDDPPLTPDEVRPVLSHT